MTKWSLRDAPFDMWGGGPRLKLKKIVWRHKSQKKKVFWKCEQKKKVCCRNWWKICWQETTPNGTYIIGKAYDKEFLRHNIKKKLSDVDRQKKACFPPEVKNKFASNKNSKPPPPQISNDASLICLLPVYNPSGMMETAGCYQLSRGSRSAPFEW